MLVAGPARNCEGSVKQTYEALLRATSRFREVFFLFVESDSDDATIKVLTSICDENSNASTLSLGRLSKTISERTDRLAICRNRIKEELVDRSEFERVDYVILADLDGVNAELTRTTLNPAWTTQQNWDVATANQDGPYYDIWALRHPAWAHDDCWVIYDKLAPVFGDKKAFNLAVSSRQIQLSDQARPVEVESAFGGLGIYTRAAFLSGTYVGHSDDGRPICEHVPFHQELRRNGFRIFIMPAMLNKAQIEHEVRPMRIFRIARRLKREVLRLAYWRKYR